MRVLITGGAGFIGSEFVRLCVAEGDEVCVLDALTYAGDRERLREVAEAVRFVRTDVTDWDRVNRAIEDFKPDGVVHLAAESHVDRSIRDSAPFLRTNVEGTRVILEASRRHAIDRIVHISTDEVYGALGKDGHFAEDSPIRPNSPYAASKAGGELLARAYHHTYGLPVSIVRPCNNFGPWQYPEKLLPVILAKALRHESLPLYGAGSNVREWLHVSDCCTAISRVLREGKPGRVYNVGSGIERSNIEVAKLVLGLLGEPEGLISFVDDRPGHDFRYSLDSSRLRSELGWSPDVSFERGFEKTVEWYAENRKWLFSKFAKVLDSPSRSADALVEG